MHLCKTIVKIRKVYFRSEIIVFLIAINVSKSIFWRAVYVVQQLIKNLGDTAFHTLIFLF